MRTINAPGLPTPPGHCEHALQVGDLLFFSGELGIGPNGDPNREIEDQVLHVLNTLEAVLNTIGLGRTAITKTTPYITDTTLWSRVDQAYVRFFGGHKPVRTTVPPGLLPGGAKIEIDGIACVSPITRTDNQSY